MCQAGSLEVQMLSLSIHGESAKFLIIDFKILSFGAKAQSGACFYKASLIKKF